VIFSTHHACRPNVNSVASAGDFDGDGYPDILIGIPSVNYNTGAVYLIYGGEDLNNIQLPPSVSQGKIINGFNITDQLGWQVAPSRRPLHKLRFSFC
jgi:hypothetical protein